MKNSKQFKAVRAGGRRMVLGVIYSGAIGAVITAWAAGNDILMTAQIAFAFCVLSFFAKRFVPSLTDYVLVLATIGQTALITAAFAGHAWQMDSHMLYYAVLAVLFLLLNPNALLAAAGLIALHHATLSIALPALVYPNSDVGAALWRTAFHGGVIVMETALLYFAVRKRVYMMKKSAEDNAELRLAQVKAEKSLAEASEARDAARTAQLEAEKQTQRAQQALAETTAQIERTHTADAAAQAATIKLQTEQQKSHEAVENVVSALSAALASLAANDLNAPIVTPFSKEYESIRSNYNDAVASLTTTIENVTQQIGQIRATASEIASAAKNHAKRSEGRAQSMSDVTVSLQSLGHSIDIAAQSAATANKTVATSQHFADDGAKVVEECVTAMQEIEESAGEISQIVNLIEDIAFQTNLLALNAGVEAARAGDAGRGFAVVATEVRALAQRSSDSANEIKSLITKSEEQVQNGVSLVEKSGVALTRILETVQKTNHEVTYINQSIQEQNQSLSDITTVLEGLDCAAQEDAEMIEETSVTSVVLDNSTNSLSKAVSVFSIGTAPSMKSVA
jgi:methyl-accepting chemotaxis protein